MKEKLKAHSGFLLLDCQLLFMCKTPFIGTEGTRVAEIKFNSSLVLNSRGGNKEVEM